MLENVEAEIRRVLPNATVFTHLEPSADSASWDDIQQSGHQPPIEH
jgi:hypothetical protein